MGNLLLSGKDLLIRADQPVNSPDGPAVIRGTGAAPTVSFTSGETQACRLVGIVVTGANHQSEGGAVLCSGSRPRLVNCIIESNSARRGGGIASTAGASPELVNCVLRGNTAGELGGAVFCSGGNVSLINCTLAANSAPQGASLACRSPRLASPGIVLIRNCILWNLLPEVANLDASTIDIAHSTVHGGWPVGGNLAADPRFMRPPNPAGGDLGDLRLRSCSPCGNAGTLAGLPPDWADLDGDADLSEPVPLDLDANARVRGASVDMGAYELTQAGESLADLNGDCLVDESDLLLFTSCATGPGLGPPDPACTAADLDGDQDVDQADFGIIQSCFGWLGAPPDPLCIR